MGRKPGRLRPVHIVLWVAFVLAVCGAATVQHLVQGVLPLPRFYVIPALVGATFGYLVVRIMALRDHQRACIVEMEQQEQKIRKLNAELEDRVEVRTQELHSTQEQLAHSQKMEAIGLLAGGIAHDFNNILTSVLSGTSLLLAREEDASKRKLLQEIERSGQRANKLTRQLLTLGKKQPRQVERLELNRLLAELLPMLETTVAGKATLEAKVCKHPLEVDADQSQLEQVMLNLVLNARDAAEDAQGKVTIYTERVPRAELPSGLPLLKKSAKPHIATIAVEDDGKGIAPEHQARIFEPFFSTKGQNSGSGLGLSIIYSIVQQSGGEVAVLSKKGRGARFTVYLPTAG